MRLRTYQPSNSSSARKRRDGVDGVTAIEIEPGRIVPENWDRALFESWGERQARRRAAGGYDERLERRRQAGHQ